MGLLFFLIKVTFILRGIIQLETITIYCLKFLKQLLFRDNFWLLEAYLFGKEENIFLLLLGRVGYFVLLWRLGGGWALHCIDRWVKKKQRP